MSKIPIAIVGLNFGGHIVDQIVSGVGSDHLQLAAVCDMDEEKVNTYAEKFGVPAYTDLNALLKNDDIPTIGLYTGPGGRAALLDTIISAGKDVMTTKPFENDCATGLAVLKKAKDIGRIIHLNSPAPTDPEDLAVVRQWQDTHELGRPIACNLSVWVRYHEKPDGRWYDDPEKCPVSPIFRLGIYLINDLVSFFGEAEKVTVFSSRIFTERPTADNGQLSILFKSGAIATVFASFCIEDGDHYRNSMTLNFEKGTVYRNVGHTRTGDQNDSGAHLALIKGSGHVQRSIIEETTVGRMSGHYQWKEFASAVRGEAINERATPESIIAGLRIIEAMRAAELGNGVAEVKPVS